VTRSVTRWVILTHSDSMMETLMDSLRVTRWRLDLNSETRTEILRVILMQTVTKKAIRLGFLRVIHLPTDLNSDSLKGFPRGFQMETHLVILMLTETVMVTLKDSRKDFHLPRDLMTATRLEIRTEILTQKD